ncbi:MAG: NAD(P)H-hydrate dehydratase [Myxococcales bacterium]|nr:MAG: NAD(P)H-hydrate dehydratase [Myxococcales bacterium]
MSPKRRAVAKVIDAALLRRWPLPKLQGHADKVSRGDVLVVGGSQQIPGAVLLAGQAALRAGAGRVQVATARGAAPALAMAFPEARVIGLSQTRQGEIGLRGARELADVLARAKAVLIGPGMREQAAAEQLLREALRAKHEFTAVLDAAALRIFRDRTPLRSGSLAGVIATPHAGEMADLWGCEAEAVHQDPLALATEAARSLGITLVLKGVETFIVEPDGTAFRNIAGNSGLATSGSGDVLSGIISGLAARGATPVQAAVWGVYLHAKAGDSLARSLGPLGYLARELPACVPPILARLSRG